MSIDLSVISKLSVAVLVPAVKKLHALDDAGGKIHVIVMGHPVV